MNKASFQRVEEYIANAMPENTCINLREHAKKDLQEYGFPSPQTEHWKYTSTKKIMMTDYASPNKLTVSSDEIASYLLKDTYRIVFVNGYYSPELSVINTEKIKIEALEKSPYLGTAATSAQTGFVALGTLLFKEGVTINILQTLDKSLHILHLATFLIEPTAIHQRTLISLASSVEATIFEQFTTHQSENYWRNHINEIFLAKSAALTYVKLQDEAITAMHTDYVVVEQSEGSQLTSFVFHMGSQLARHDLITRLNEIEARCELNGIYLVKNKQHVDNHTDIRHLSEKTYSQEYYKGLIKDQGHGVFNGRVFVEKNAQKVDSAQKNANLLLSKEAEIDTKPELEIYADDVKCAHGATVGQLSADAIFYLRVRGINEAEARNLLMYGFANEIIMTLSNTDIRALLKETLLNWLMTEPEFEALLT